MEHNSEYIDNTRTWFERGLNEHGYSFQHSLLNAAERLRNANKSGWVFLASEFPVEVRGRGTRIDFILQRLEWKDNSGFTRNDSQTIFILAECKRANPDYANWCFVKAPYLYRGQYDNFESLVFEEINIRSEDAQRKGDYYIEGIGNCNVICGRELRPMSSENIFHIAVEVRQDVKGNCVSSDSGRDAVEIAASQVCQGLNGMINFLAGHEDLWKTSSPVTLLPVIFTTANLWASDADLSAADLETGDLKFERHGFKKVPWLFFQYRLSPGLKHNIPSEVPSRSLPDILQAEYIRTVPIVSANGLEDFIQYMTALDFRD